MRLSSRTQRFVTRLFPCARKRSHIRVSPPRASGRDGLFWLARHVTLPVSTLLTRWAAVERATPRDLPSAMLATRSYALAVVEVAGKPGEWFGRRRDAGFLEAFADEVGGDQGQCGLVSRMRWSSRLGSAGSCSDRARSARPGPRWDRARRPSGSTLAARSS
jgi:hypothetical protein